MFEDVPSRLSHVEVGGLEVAEQCRNHWPGFLTESRQRATRVEANQRPRVVDLVGESRDNGARLHGQPAKGLRRQFGMVLIPILELS